ncbi:DUF6040 family protein [Lacrimispora defluvii]|uniref:DUF6040 family protein n=1 Tax=Lacrimispora defluvii TaxID=2719233 RepID=UPI0034DD9971
MFVLGKKYIRFFKTKQADEISVFVGLMILTIVVFASDLNKTILSINQESWFNVCVASVIVIGHFFGVIGIIAFPIGGIMAYSDR